VKNRTGLVERNPLKTDEEYREISLSSNGNPHSILEFKGTQQLGGKVKGGMGTGKDRKRRAWGGQKVEKRTAKKELLGRENLMQA